MTFDESFSEYLKNEKGKATTTIKAYCADAADFCEFMESERHRSPLKAGNADVAAYLMKLKDAGKSAATVNRKLASIRSYYTFLVGKGEAELDPTDNIKSPRIPRKEVEYLSVDEIDRLLSAPDDSDKGLRDKALLEVMYATGMRASEAAAARLSDLNLRIGFISVTSESGKTRIIPIGRPARAALEKYLDGVRQRFVGEGEDCGALFVNYLGQSLSRQGIWKTIRYYGAKTGLGEDLNPQILRNSFAAHMIQNGADLKSLQDLLGHEDITATKIFLTVTKNRIMDVYDRSFPRA